MPVVGVYPFFVIESKSDGPSGDCSLYVATEKYPGGSASCVSVAKCLNRQLKGGKSKKVPLIKSS
jgi:hypothetical protein